MADADKDKEIADSAIKISPHLLNDDIKGLSTEEAEKLVRQYGLNAIKEQKKSSLIIFLSKFWGPVSWMLEFTFIIELILGKYAEAYIIIGLILFNAIIAFTQEHKANEALELLKQQLKIITRVLRDGKWIKLSAEELVPGDIIHIRMGDLAPADAEIISGNVMVDQSSLTGESQPVDRNPGWTIYAGSIIKRGEATCKVVATGAASYFGKTAELIKSAKIKGYLEELIMKIVKYFIMIDGILVGAILIYAFIYKLNFGEILPFALILLVASIPVTLPVTFTLATALASLELSKKGVLVTHLSAVENIASMEELCCDKTGTLTMNGLMLSTIRPHGNFTEQDLLKMASVASSEATMDAMDKVILDKAKELNISVPQKIKFIPFDPVNKRSEARYEEDGKHYIAIKGSPLIIKEFDSSIDWEKESAEFSKRGERTIAVLGGEEGSTPKFYGLLALSDPVRPDSKYVISLLKKDLNISVRMLTGDNSATAIHIAEKLGINGEVCDYNSLKKEGKVELKPEVLNCDVYADIFPEDKYNLVRALQKEGKVIGMTGDGVNDALAIKQAQVGIAVAGATDVAKASAGLILTKPGLENIVDAVKDGRMVYQRMLTYTLNKISKTFQVAFFLSLGLLIFGVFVTTPTLILILIFVNNFVSMSIAEDNVIYSNKPDKWNIKLIVSASLLIAVAWLIYSFLVYIIGAYFLSLSLAKVQTLVFLALVFSSQATIYLVRERRHFYESRPGTYLLLATIGDLIVVNLMAYFGILMSPIPLIDIITLLIGTFIYMIILDFIKFPLIKKLIG
ncbi:MAG: plasma-membrane proton-efflux P-type ATPase [Deltaproteobacteria bacterium]|jgi:H+-transporting ATPase|nr:plasma-membrane proton-efflux P-type ATPase [Deltaproteobacteria bacterium]MCL5879944.1 plasma-membrane proton-efflux P-type ATPase [Deltaproteobacteria bacterium]MDA8304345.1 plasma-membrane proton-efflux P-type ATPase [Deltaproteobacteria bacterium]